MPHPSIQSMPSQQGTESSPATLHTLGCPGISFPGHTAQPPTPWPTPTALISPIPCTFCCAMHLPSSELSHTSCAAPCTYQPVGSHTPLGLRHAPTRQCASRTPRPAHHRHRSSSWGVRARCTSTARGTAASTPPRSACTTWRGRRRSAAASCPPRTRGRWTRRWCPGACVCVCMRAGVRVGVRACVRACVRVCVRVCGVAGCRHVRSGQVAVWFLTVRG